MAVSNDGILSSRPSLIENVNEALFDEYSFENGMESLIKELNVPRKRRLSKLIAQMMSERVSRQIANVHQSDCRYGPMDESAVKIPAEGQLPLALLWQPKTVRGQLEENRRKHGTLHHARKQSARASTISILHGHRISSMSKGGSRHSVVKGKHRMASIIESNGTLPELPDLNSFLDNLLGDVMRSISSIRDDLFALDGPISESKLKNPHNHNASEDSLDQSTAAATSKPPIQPVSKRRLNSQRRLKPIHISHREAVFKPTVGHDSGGDDQRGAVVNGPHPTPFVEIEPTHYRGEWDKVGKKAYLSAALQDAARIKVMRLMERDREKLEDEYKQNLRLIMKLTSIPSKIESKEIMIPVINNLSEGSIEQVVEPQEPQPPFVPHKLKRTATLRKLLRKRDLTSDDMQTLHQFVFSPSLPHLAPPVHLSPLSHRAYGPTNEIKSTRDDVKSKATNFPSPSSSPSSLSSKAITTSFLKFRNEVLDRKGSQNRRSVPSVGQDSELDMIERSPRSSSKKCQVKSSGGHGTDSNARITYTSTQGAYLSPRPPASRPPASLSPLKSRPIGSNSPRHKVKQLIMPKHSILSELQFALVVEQECSSLAVKFVSEIVAVALKNAAFVSSLYSGT